MQADLFLIWSSVLQEPFSYNVAHKKVTQYSNATQYRYIPS